MAARTLKPHHQDDIRAKIRTIELIRYLQCGIFGTKYNGAVGIPGLAPQKVRAIEVLLRKTLPDLANVELSGPNGGALTVRLQAADADA